MSSIKLRKKARQFLVQALYQWQISGDPSHEITAQFLVDNEGTKFDTDYFKQVLEEIVGKTALLDEKFSPWIKRPLDTLDPIELAILRLAAYELLCKIDIPYRVVINEAVEQAKKFGATDGHKFVNGVLDKMAQDIRKLEFEQDRKNS